jgi:hypothetical protein
LESIDIDAGQVTFILGLRTSIAAFVETQAAAERLAVTTKKLRELLTLAEKTIGSSDEISGDESRLRALQSGCKSLVDSSKPWSLFKRLGAEALSNTAKEDFDKLAAICSVRGLIINRHGELESMLVDQGIPYTTDKKAWIQQSLILLPNLQIEPSKHLWMLIHDVHNQLGRAASPAN